MTFTIEGKTYHNGTISSVYKNNEAIHTLTTKEPILCDSGRIEIDKEMYGIVLNTYNNGRTELIVKEIR